MGLEHCEPEFRLKVLAPPVTASQVCRSWRHSLLSDPAMWTCLVLAETDPKWILELLRRSKSAPLNVFVHLNDACESGFKDTLDMITTLFGQIHRFAVLRLQIDDWGYPLFETLFRSSISVIMSSIQRPAPMLQTFSYSYGYPQVDEENDPDTVIEHLFSGFAPNLKRVHYRFPMYSQEIRGAAFSNVLELYLALPWIMKPDFFLNVLEASPRLKMLHMRSRDEVCVDFHEVFDRRIHLPHLETLVLDVPYALYNIVESFMIHTTFPSNIKWQISVFHSSYNSQELPHLLQFLSQTRLTYIHAQISAFSCFRFETSAPTLPGRAQPLDKTLIYTYYPEDELTGLWNPMMHVVNSYITHVELEPDGLLSGYGIIPFVFARLTRLESLTICSAKLSPHDTNNIPLKCLVALLLGSKNIEGSTDPPQNQSDALASQPQAAIPCPRLHTVTLQLRNSLNTEHVEIITKCLRIRREMGHPLGISLFCPEVYEAALQILEQSKLGGTIKVHIIPSES